MNNINVQNKVEWICRDNKHLLDEPELKEIINEWSASLNGSSVQSSIALAKEEASREGGKKYLTDDKGNKSLMRLMSFIALISAMLISAVILILDMISLHSVSLVSLFIFGAFAPKALQKFAETK